MINWVTQLSIKEKVKLFNKLYDELAGYGREGDTELAHVNPFEAKLLKAVGGSGTINPVTGLREYKGGGKAPPPPATQTVRQEATIPEELKPFVTDILEESQAQYRQRQEEGYVPYEGAQIAQFTPEQQQAFQATRGIFEQGLAGTPLGQSTTYLAPALGATTASTLPTTAANIGRYMDPYLENVLRVQEQEARRADEISRQGRAAQAVQAGAFGGSREAVMEAEAQRGLEDRLASLRASGMSQAFQTAQQMAEAQRARELAAGRQFAALGETAAQQQAREIGGLAATGEAIRGQRQAGLDIAKTQFMEEQQFPQTQLQQYSSIIRGFPLTPSQLQTSQTVTPQPSLTQQLLGAGIGAAGLAGAFGAFKKEGGLVGLAEGGRPMDAMPMAAMPMKPRRRAADLGSAIGDLAQRMGTGRSMSQIGGGLTSVLSAPAMSENMQQMMPQQASATPMQMPSQRFMNAGGKVGYYQQGTGVSVIDLRKSLEEAIAQDDTARAARIREQISKQVMDTEGDNPPPMKPAGVPFVPVEGPPPPAAPDPKAEPKSMLDMYKERLVSRPSVLQERAKDIAQFGRDREVLAERGKGILEREAQQVKDIETERMDLIRSQLETPEEQKLLMKRLDKMADEETRMKKLGEEFDRDAWLSLAQFGAGLVSNVNWGDEAQDAIKSFAQTRKEERAAKAELAKDITDAMTTKLDLSNAERKRALDFNRELLSSKDNIAKSAVKLEQSLLGLDEATQQSKRQDWADLNKLTDDEMKYYEAGAKLEIDLMEARAEGSALDLDKFPSVADDIAFIAQQTGTSRISTEFQQAAAALSEEARNYILTAAIENPSIVQGGVQDKLYKDYIARRIREGALDNLKPVFSERVGPGTKGTAEDAMKRARGQMGRGGSK